MSILAAIDKLTEAQERRHAWLLRAGPIARQLNEESNRRPAEQAAGDER